MFKHLIPLRKLISKSSLLSIFQDYLPEKSPKNVINRSYNISRKGLTIIRSILFLYSLTVLVLALSLWNQSNRLLLVPNFILILQTIYFGAAMISSFKRERPNNHEGEYKIVGILFQIVFSFQFYNLLHYFFLVLPKDIVWKGGFWDNLSWINATVLSFGAIWTEQFFNMVRFRSKNVLFVLATSVLILSLNVFTSFLGKENTKTEAFNVETLFGNLLLLVTPAMHFMIGNRYYQKKRQEKNQKIQKLSKALINFRAVSELGGPFM